jgi:hypothetical protein
MMLSGAVVVDLTIEGHAERGDGARGAVPIPHLPNRTTATNKLPTEQVQKTHWLAPYQAKKYDKDRPNLVKATCVHPLTSRL